MKRAFIINIDTQGDTDLIGLSDDILNAVQEKGIAAIDCKAWASSLTPVGSTLPSIPLAKPPTQPPPPPVNFNNPPS